MNEPSSVLIVGAGAVGAVVGWALSKQGATVYVTCRSDFAAVRQSGYEIDFEGSVEHFFPASVLRDASEYPGHAEYVVLCTKITPDVDRVALIRPAIGAGTCIVLIENGIDIEQEIHAAFPENELASVAAYIRVGRTGHGKVSARRGSHFTIGGFPATTERMHRFAQLCNDGGLPTRVTDNLLTARWQKAVWNSVFNPISVLGAAADTHAMLANPERLRLVRAAMTEVASIARAAGHPLREDVVERTIQGTKALPAYKTSMALDFEDGRPMETEVMLGNVVRAARRLDVPTPTLDALYALMQLVETRSPAEEGV